jgi:hypothetical protein
MLVIRRDGHPATEWGAMYPTPQFQRDAFKESVDHQAKLLIKGFYNQAQ